jgi:3-isopropylmalate dehydratase small subunit
MKIKGRVHLFGDNIDTDQIYPGRYLELTEPEDLALYAMNGVDPRFVETVNQGDIVVAGVNFGCGSSREHAVISLKAVGVGAVVAQSFARIFYRNAINQGLPVVEVPNLDLRASVFQAGTEMAIDLQRGFIEFSNGEYLNFVPLPESILEILKAGGVFDFYKDKINPKSVTDRAC